MASALSIPGAASSDLQDIGNDNKCRASPLSRQQIQSLSTTMAKPKKKRVKRKKKGKGKAEDADQKTIQWSGLRMTIESTFGPPYAWLSEMLETQFMYSQRKSGVTVDSVIADMFSIFVKHKYHGADMQFFLNLADVTSRNWGQALLLLAIERENIAAVRRLFTEGQAEATFLDADGRPALLYASCKDNTEIILELLQHGADIHFIDHKGRNAIWYACNNDNCSVLEVLVNNEAILPDVDEDEESGKNLFVPLRPSQSSDIIKFEEFLLPHRPKVDNKVSDLSNPGSSKPPDLETESVEESTESDESSNLPDNLPNLTIPSDSQDE
jgi:hypothetical protein